MLFNRHNKLQKKLECYEGMYGKITALIIMITLGCSLFYTDEQSS